MDIEKILYTFEDDYNPSSMVPGPRNMYASGQLVQPNVDGSRPGYQGKKPFEKVTIDGKVYKKDPDTGLISFRTTDKNREYKMLRLTPEEVKKRITAPGKAGYASDVPAYERTTVFKKRKEAEKKGLIYDSKTKTFKKPPPTKQEGEQAINKINSWTKKWINTNSKNYGVRDFNKFKKDLAKAWKEQLKVFEKDPKFRIATMTNLSTEEGLPFVKNLNVNGVSTPIKKDPTLGFEKIFYDQMFKNKDFKKKVTEYLDFVNIDKRFGSVRDDLVAQGKIATDTDGKAFFKKSSGSKKAYLNYAKFIDEDVVYFFGDVLNSRRLYNNNPGSLNIYSIIEKNTPPEKIQKYRKKLATSYSSWMNNLKEVADLAGMDFNKVLEMQYNEAAKMKKLFNVSELPFDFQYAQDHLFGLAEAKELGDPKIAKQTLKNLVATTKAQNAYLGTKGFTQKRTKLIRNFKNAPLENKANIVNQLNVLANEYVPGRLQYNVKKDGSLKITNLQPEKTFKERASAYKDITKTFPKNIKKVLQDFEKHGCGLAAGGRILFSEGTPGGKPTKCAQKGIARFIDDLKKGNYSKATMNLLKGGGNLVKNILNPMELLKLRNYFGPAALGFMGAFEAGVITNDMVRKNTPLNEALANNWLTKSFLPYTKQYAQAKNLLESGKVPSNMKKYVKDVVTFNEMLMDMKGIEGRKDSRLIDDTGYGMIDGTSMYTKEQEAKDEADLMKKAKTLSENVFIPGTAKELEYKKMLDEMEATRMAKDKYSPFLGFGGLKDRNQEVLFDDYMSPVDTPKDLRPITYMDAEYEDVKKLPASERQMYENYFTKEGILQPRQSLSELMYDADTTLYDEILKDYNAFQRQKFASQFPGYYGANEPDRFMEGGIASLNVKK